MMLSFSAIKSCSWSCSSSSMVNSFFLLSALITGLSWFVPTCHGATCNLLDRDNLLSFAKNISMIASSQPLNWNPSSDCCISWEGVSCDDSTGKVIGLNLPSRGLLGIIPDSISSLTSLQKLGLSQNSLTGTLPDGLFSSLDQLQVINVSYNRLSGQIPALGVFPGAIREVDFSSNGFNGTLQPEFFNQAVNLVSFNISNNSFFGSLPSFICSISPGIVKLDFSSNQFNGVIQQDVGACLNLETLRAGFNSLSGPLPQEIYSLTSLTEIFIPGNSLNGSLISSISNLKNLTSLALYANELSGPIPPEIGSLSNIKELLLHVNKFNGTLPASITNCTQLTEIILRVNLLFGDLTMLNFSRLTQLNTIDLGNNNFTGTLPTTLFSCTSLVAIRFATNGLTGEIPPSIQNLQALQFLSISNNSLSNVTGALTVLAGCRNLSTVILSKNFYNETLPGDYSLIDPAGFQDLHILGLGACLLYGQVPSWLLHLPKLVLIDLSYNRLTSSIPSWLGTLPNLFYLDLSYNNLTGSIPVKLTELPRLASQQNNQVEDNSYLELPVFVNPENVSKLQYNQLSSLPPAIYLASNNLSGSIPPEIGQLKFIHILDLSHNKFSGTIPSTLSNLTNLEFLDLSNNQLSGEIPASLGILHFLSSFNVANNNLEGPIPTGGQFDTFPVENFAENAGLCGRLLQRSCSQPTGASPPKERKSPKKKIMIGLVLGICFGVGITLSMVAFWIFSKRRVNPKSDQEKDDMEANSFDSNISGEFGKDNGMVILFPNNTDGIKDLTFSELLKATDDFNQSNIIGCGGFGLVYKATLSNGTQLAIKKLTGDMGLMEREFKAEVEVLSTAKHGNLVALQGYCVHDGFRLLIYSYMENGSLDYWLHEKSDGASQLDWPTRLRISHDAGCGLAYMHTICEPHIVHRDIKSSNILLDKKFKAHVADFGLSRLILPYRTHVTTELVGTLGYIPPEYSQSWMATLRGDVYSFGVVMLELLTGKRPMEIFKPKVSRDMVAWVHQMRSEGKQSEIFDPILRENGFEEDMLRVLDIACMCVNQSQFKRPSIMEVVNWLEDITSSREEPKEEEEHT